MHLCCLKKTETKNVCKKRSYKLQRELVVLQQIFENLENEILRVQELINNPAFFQRSNDGTQLMLQKLSETETELKVVFKRWEELGEMQKE